MGMLDFLDSYAKTIEKWDDKNYIIYASIIIVAVVIWFVFFR